MKFLSKGMFLKVLGALFVVITILGFILYFQPKQEESPFRLCDLNRNGVCDETDKLIFTSAFGACRGEKTYNFNADIDGDGCVVTADENYFLQTFEDL